MIHRQKQPRYRASLLTRTKIKSCEASVKCPNPASLTLKVLGATIDAQWEGMGDVGSARYEPALLPPMPHHKGFKLQLLVFFQKFSTLRVNNDQH